MAQREWAMGDNSKQCCSRNRVKYSRRQENADNQIKKRGGTIEFESEEGEGTFTVTPLKLLIFYVIVAPPISHTTVLDVLRQKTGERRSFIL